MSDQYRNSRKIHDVAVATNEETTTVRNKAPLFHGLPLFGESRTKEGVEVVLDFEEGKECDFLQSCMLQTAAPTAYQVYRGNYLKLTH